MLRSIINTSLVAAIVSHAYSQSITAALTYQGRLESAGTPANGAHDMQFQLFTQADGGSQIGPTVCLDGVPLTDGLFTVSLDFGDVFDGSKRFLQVSLRADTTADNCASGAFSSLSPRQSITAVPYALKVAGLDGFSLDASDGSPADALYVNSAGNVGIGTVSPAQRLSVVGTVQSTSGGFMFPDGSVQVAAAGSSQWSVSGTHIFNTNSGNVGIGTNSPTRKLEVHASQSTLNMTSTANANGSVLELRNNIAGPTNYGAVNFLNSVGAAVGQIAFAGDSSLRLSNSLERMRITSDGRVGIGTSAPGKSLHVAADEPVLILQDVGSTTMQTGYIGFWNGNPTETGWFGFATPGSPHFSVNNARPDGNIVLTPGAGGVVTVPILEITGADIAEKFPSSDAVEPGMVVAIDPVNPGKLCLARGSYNQCVAGVVSGANNFKVGAVLGNLPGLENAPPIALSGRVYVWCDATDVAIRPGDLLTTSDTPGHAMKAADRERSQGAVIGKAMERLESGRGMVMVLVNLQ